MDSQQEGFNENLDFYLSLLTNRAQCYLNLQELLKSLKDCDKAISLKSSYAKAYFRKSQILKKMEDWRGALQALTDGFVFAPEDPSFQKELDVVNQKIKDIKTEMLKNMVVFGLTKAISLIPAEQTFHKIQVRDDTGEDALKKDDQAALSTASTSDYKSASKSSVRSSVDGEAKTGSAKTGDTDGIYDFLKLRKIDNDGPIRSSPHERLAITEDYHADSVQSGSKSGGAKSVRFNLKEQPPTRSKTMIKRDVASLRLRSSLKKISKFNGYNGSRFMIENNQDADNSDHSEPELIAPHLLNDYRQKASKISNATQFWDFWRSFKKEPETQEWILREVGPSKFQSIFAKGIESDTFWSIFEIVR